MALADEKRLHEDERTQAQRALRAAKQKLTRETGELFARPARPASRARTTSGG